MRFSSLWQTIFTGFFWLSLPGIFALAQDDADDQQERGNTHTQVERAVVAQPRQDADDEDKDDDEVVFVACSSSKILTGIASHKRNWPDARSEKKRRGRLIS